MICFVFKPRRRVNGQLRESRYYSGKLRMEWERGLPRTVALHTTDGREAYRKLNEMRVVREKRYHGLLPPEEQAGASGRPLKELLEAFLDDLRVRRRAMMTIKKYRTLLFMFSQAGWTKLADITAKSFKLWRARSDLSPKTLNDTLANIGTFFRWLIDEKMVSANALAHVDGVENRRCEKYRRALTKDEAQRLISSAPRERAVVYLTALNTGLRRNELQQLTVEDFVLDSQAPFVRVRASTAKHPKESKLRLCPEVVTAIRSIIPAAAGSSSLVFAGKIPRIPTLRRDLEKAGISFEDSRGCRADFHALRDTFGTNIAAAGVAPFVLKELMRHSTIQQAEKYYIDARHLPLASAIGSD